MLWLENPINCFTIWRPAVIAYDPDIFVIDAVLNTIDGTHDCLISAQFFTFFPTGRICVPVHPA